MAARKTQSVRFGGATTFPPPQQKSSVGARGQDRERSSTAAPARPRSSISRPRHLHKPTASPADDSSTRDSRIHSKQIIPPRSSRLSERLVLLPDTADDEDKGDFDRFTRESNVPPGDSIFSNSAPGLKTKSYAERLPKSRRAHKIARVTAYCPAQAYKLKPTADFVKRGHLARTKLYDDCLYCVYHLPLMNGEGGYRVRSGPVLKNPKGKAILDEEIERNERRDYEIGYFGDSEHFQVPNLDRDGNHEGILIDRERLPSPPPHQHADRLQLGEVFVFSYGVIVFWNFTQDQEKNILADLTFSVSETGVNPVIRPQSEDEIETEKFNFEYNADIPHPRVYNDMFTLRSRDHMIKLAISHAVAQSTKLCFFEERMHQTMQETVHVPQVLAKTGDLGMRRSDVMRTIGRLFQNRVDVNLSSNVLDVPKFLWDTEPTLHPLYTAVREYLEIQPRIQALNERCQVFLDLASVMSDTLAHTRMSKLTWVIIILIVLSIMVTIGEVVLRFTILTRSGSVEPGYHSIPGLEMGLSGDFGGGSGKFGPGVGLIEGPNQKQKPVATLEPGKFFSATTEAVLSVIDLGHLPIPSASPKMETFQVQSDSDTQDYAFVDLLDSNEIRPMHMPMLGL